MLYLFRRERQQSKLVNGIPGAVVAVVYLSTAGVPALPDLVISTFDSYIGPHWSLAYQIQSQLFQWPEYGIRMEVSSQEPNFL